MSATRLWILGASDPEMTAIETLLRDAGESVAYAVGPDGKRVHPGNAYKAVDVSDGWAWGAVTHLIECGPIAGAALRPDVICIDHHRPGDPGYGLPPEQFLGASSVGQVLRHLHGLGLIARPPMTYCRLDRPDLMLVAAADHCLEAAYRGRCPGVDPDALMQWRAESRTAFQKRPVADVLADIEAARRRLREAVARIEREYPMGGGSVIEHHLPDAPVADLRGQSIPELPEAAVREGVPFLADQTDRDGRKKVVLMAAPPDLVQRFLAGEIVPGLVDTYGDPARGFAGGYLPS